MKKISVFLFSFISITCLSQGFNKVKMDSLFSIIDDNQRGMGSISLFKGGKEVYSNSIGYADVEKKVENSARTRYRIGSITKTFTAVLVMQMAEDKKIDPDQPIEKYFPELKHGEEITVEHLLRHRSGLHNFTSDSSYMSWMDEPKTREEMLEVIRGVGSDFPADSTARYSNTNYVLLTLIAEKVSGMKYSELLQQKIIKPLGLKNTYYGREIRTAENEARSYSYMGDWEKDTETDMSIPMGAGSIVSTPYDLNTFYTALFTGKLVSEKSLRKMKDMQDGYGIGLFEMPFFEKISYGHTGGIDGFRSMVGYFPEDNLSIAYCSNAVRINPNDIMLGVLHIYFGMEYELPEFSDYKVSSEELDKYLGVFGSPDFPLDITITKEGNTLMGQGTGQPKFPLEPVSEHVFRFEPAGVEITFTPSGDQLKLKQGTGLFVLDRK